MIPSTHRTFAALVISLVIQVISLTGMAFAAPAPNVANLEAVTNGVVAPARIAIDNQSPPNYYIADSRAGGVLVVNAWRKLEKVIKTAAAPKGVAIGTAGTTNGKILVSQGNFVSVYDPATGVEQRKLGSGVGQFSSADGIAVDALGYIYVVDSNSNPKAVKIFESNGDLRATNNTLSTWVGGPATTFNYPTAIAYEKANNQIAVADTLGGRVMFYNLSGSNLPTYAKWIGSTQLTGGVPGNLLFQYPTGVSFEYAGSALSRMYVVDNFNTRVQAIDPNDPTYDALKGYGLFLSNIGSYGTKPGELVAPFDTAFDSVHGLLLVSNGNSNIVAYGIDGGGWEAAIPAPTVAITNKVAGALPEAVDGTVAVAGTSANADAIKLVVTPSGAEYTVTVGASWNYTIPAAAFVPGTNTVTVRATNRGITAATDSATVAWASQNGSVTISPVSITNLSLVPVTGTVTAGGTVQVCNTTPDPDSCVTAVVTGTAWSAAVTLEEGVNHVTAHATWPSSLPKDASADITRDTVLPTLVVSAIAGGSVTSTQLQNVAGSATDANGVTVTVNAQPVTVTNGLFSAAVVLHTGSNAITVEATDGAGNKATNTRYVSFDFDPERPKVSIAASDLSSTRSLSAILTGTSANADYLTVNSSPVSIDAGTGNWTTSVDLAAGLNTVEVVASSALQKASSAKLTLFRVDTAPELAVNSPLQDIATYSLNNLGITGTVTSSATVAARFDGVDVTVNKSGATFTLDLPLPAERATAYPLVVTATDAGQTATTVRNVLIDRTQPLLTIDVANSTPSTIVGTTDNGGYNSIVVKKDGVTVAGTSTINNDGTWSVDMAGVTYDPTSATVTAADVAGNTNVKSPYPSIIDGDVNVDRMVTTADALVCQRLLIYSEPPSLQELAHGDCTPVVATACSPDGILDIGDCLLILSKAQHMPVPYP